MIDKVGGIKVSSVLGEYVIPKLIKRGLMYYENK